MKDPDKNEAVFDDDDDFDYEQYETCDEDVYGHGFVSKDADGVNIDSAYIRHLIDPDSDEELSDDLSEGEAEEAEKQIEEYLHEWAVNKINEIEKEKYNENSVYFSSVSPEKKRAFDSAVWFLRKYAHKNGGSIEVCDQYNSTWNDASVILTAKGFHFENDRALHAIMRFFTVVEIAYADNRCVKVIFTRHNYYDVKEVKL